MLGTNDPPFIVPMGHDTRDLNSYTKHDLEFL